MVPLFVSRKACLLEQSPYRDGAELNSDARELRELEALGFTAEEAERLARYREWAGEHGEHAERLKFERRLDFVRWLVEHDRIQH